MADKENKDTDDEMKELSSEMNKTFSPARSVIRIIVGFFVFLLWILIGVSPTLIFSSGIQGFIGTFSFLVRNPIIFLLVAFLNIFLGVLEYILLGLIWWTAFHLIWSIRWFSGYNKYRKLKNTPTVNEGMNMKRHYQVIFEAILSILIIVDLLIMSLMIGGFAVGIMHSSVASVGRFDLLVAILILLDFVIFRVRKEKTKGGNLQFIRQNWAYIVSIIPITFISFNILHLFGFIDILWLLVLLRFYALFRVLMLTGHKVREYPSKTKLDYATVILLLVLIIGSFIFFIVERSVNPEVPNYESAVWFSIISMTTVGYGDIVPVTLIGRILGVIIILTGMGYVSLVTATLAYSFIDLFRKESGKAVKKVEERVINYEDKIDELLVKIEELDTKIDDIKNKKG